MVSAWSAHGLHGGQLYGAYNRPRRQLSKQFVVGRLYGAYNPDLCPDADESIALAVNLNQALDDVIG